MKVKSLKAGQPYFLRRVCQHLTRRRKAQGVLASISHCEVLNNFYKNFNAGQGIFSISLNGSGAKDDLKDGKSVIFAMSNVKILLFNELGC